MRHPHYPMTSLPMSFPEIAPTGAMSSGDYVDYMIAYDQQLAEYLLQQLESYYSQGVINDWNALWTRMLGDVNAQVTILGERVNKISANVTMINNIINK